MKDKEKRIVVILILALVLLDQLLKIIFLLTGAKIGNIESFSIGLLNITKSENNFQYIFIAFIAIAALIRYINMNNTYLKIDTRIIISFAIAGVISNTIDRIWKQATINYINIPRFTSINLGYLYIAIAWIGMAAILTKFTTERIKEKNENKGRGN